MNGSQNTIVTEVIDNVFIENVVVAFDEGELFILLLKEDEGGKWSLPSARVKQDEELVDASLRMLEEELDVVVADAYQIGVFGSVGRVEGKRVFGVAYLSLVRKSAIDKSRGDKVTGWYNIDSLPELINDHARIIAETINDLKRKIRFEPLAFKLLPQKFTLTELQKLLEKVLGKVLDKRNFRKKILKMAFIKDTGGKQEGVAHRAAKLYSFERSVCIKMLDEGYEMDLI